MAIYRLNQPYKGFSEPVFVEFAHGTSHADHGDVLAQKGVIEDRGCFWRLALCGATANLQAGEYKFESPPPPLDVFGRIARGDILLHGTAGARRASTCSISRRQWAKLGTMKPATFLAAARNPALIRDLDPMAPSLEGYLFPNKYSIYRHTTAQQICRMMTDEFRAQWKALRDAGPMFTTL